MRGPPVTRLDTKTTSSNGKCFKLLIQLSYYYSLKQMTLWTISMTMMTILANAVIVVIHVMLLMVSVIPVSKQKYSFMLC